MIQVEVARLGAHTIGIRPEHIEVSTTEGAWEGTVGVSEHLGSDTFLHVDTEYGLINVRGGGEIGLHSGDTVYLTPDLSQLHKFDAQGQAI